jgi:hypothetical protein
MGKSRAALLDLIRRNPGARRADLARMKGVKAASLTHPLRWLIDAGLIVRIEDRRGCYAPADALARRVEDARELAGEPDADRQQIVDHAIERARYRYQQTGEAQPPLIPPETVPSSTPTPDPPPDGVEHWRGFVQGPAAQRASGQPPEKKTGWERVGELEGHGMRRDCAAREVFGPDSPEHRRARAEKARRGAA